MDGWISLYFSLLNNWFLLGEHLRHLLLVEGCRYQVPLPGSPVANDHLAPLFDQESVLLASHVLCRSVLSFSGNGLISNTIYFYKFIETNMHFLCPLDWALIEKIKFQDSVLLSSQESSLY